MWPFNKKGATKKCIHYKGFGDPFPENMKIVLALFPYSRGDYKNHSYKTYECSECGVRSFACITSHGMHTGITEPLDDFIEHDISISEMLEKINKYDVRTIIYHNNIGETQ